MHRHSTTICSVFNPGLIRMYGSAAVGKRITCKRRVVAIEIVKFLLIGSRIVCGLRGKIQRESIIG